MNYGNTDGTKLRSIKMETNSKPTVDAYPVDSLWFGECPDSLHDKFHQFSRSIFEMPSSLCMDQKENSLCDMIPGKGFKDKVNLCSAEHTSVPPYSLNAPGYFSSHLSHENLVNSSGNDISSKLTTSDASLSSFQQQSLYSVHSSSSEKSGQTTSADEDYIDPISPLLNMQDYEHWEHILMQYKQRPPLSWENRVNHTIKPTEYYASESGANQFWSSFENFEEEPQRSSFPNLTFVPDLIQLLLGNPSRTFSIKKQENGAWKIDLNIRPSKASRETFESVFSEFYSSSILFLQLKEFCSSVHFLHSENKDSVLNAVMIAIFEYLMCYENAVMSISSDHIQSILSLKYLFADLFKNLRSMAELVMIPSSETHRLPTGTKLISYLYEKAMQNSDGPFQTTMLLVINHAFGPFLSFLQQLLFDGTWDNTMEEFGLQHQKLYLNDQDESYWEKCFTLMNDDLSDFMPVFLKDYASDILLCAKSYTLLQDSCPNHHILNSNIMTPKLSSSLLDNYYFHDIRKRMLLAILVRISIMLLKYEVPSHSENAISLHHRLWRIIKESSVATEKQIKSSQENSNKYVLLQWMSKILENWKNSPSTLQEKRKLCSQAITGSRHVTKDHGNNLQAHSALMFRCHSWPDLKIRGKFSFPENVKSVYNSRGKLVQSASTENLSKSVCTLETRIFPLHRQGVYEQTSAEDIENCIMDILQSESVTKVLKLPSVDVKSVMDNCTTPSLLNTKLQTTSCSSNTSTISCLISNIEKYLHKDHVVRHLQPSNTRHRTSLSILHISSIVKETIVPLVRTQIDIVNKCTVDYFINELPLLQHLTLLAKYFFLSDEEFGIVLCQYLFLEFPELKTPSRSIDNHKLHQILIKALGYCGKLDSKSVDSIKLTAHSQPLHAHTSGILKRIRMDYVVPWPCNIIITKQHLTSYNKVLMFLLQIQKSLMLLKELHTYLKECSITEVRMHNSVQYRKLQYYKHVMLHFTKALKLYVSEGLLNKNWEVFLKDIKSKATTLEDLITMHNSCITAALRSCLLYKNDSLVLLVRDILKVISHVCNSLLQAAWDYEPDSRQWSHPHFKRISKHMDNFNEYSMVFYKAVKELYYRTDKDYLQGLILSMDFNCFYEKRT